MISKRVFGNIINLKTFFLFCLIFLLGIDYSFAQTSRELILQGIDATLGDNFLQAESCFEQIIKDYPQEPEGYFFLAAALQAKMMDEENYSQEKTFYQNIQKGIDLGKEKIKNNQKDARAYLFLGNSYGYLAVYEGKRGKLWSALKDGLRAKSNLKKAVDLDSTLYDAYLGLGSYYYWSSVVTKNFQWLPFFGDKRKEGIEFLKIAATKSVFSKEAAINALIWVYINEGWYPLAIMHSRDMYEKYPQGKLFLWPFAFAQYKACDWQGAYASYSQLLEKIEKTQPKTYYNLIECRTKMANALFNLGKLEECKKECEKILSYPLDEKLREKQEKNLELAKNLKKMCERES
ncbi:MAG: hypothetical protein MUO85_11015 [candidate division Zixibacteria bacterium]|nr:hypothetical protein [candidate division Zixibacteria bacterium]